MFKVWFIALCLDCEPYFPMPFDTPALRDDWAIGHRTVGHRVETGFEIERVYSQRRGE